MIAFYIVITAVLIVCIAFSAWFSSSEMALFSLKRAQILSYENGPDPARRAIFTLMYDYHQTLATIILGNMFVNSAISMLNDELLNSLHLGEAATTALSAFCGVAVLLLFGEITPMSLAYAHADSWSRTVARPLLLLRRILQPLTRVAGTFCDRILDLLGRKSPEPLSQAEFMTYLDTCVERGAFEKRQAD